MASTRQYLPGGGTYSKTVAGDVVGIATNPRGKAPVAQWLDEWEKKWQAAAGKPQPTRMSLSHGRNSCYLG